MLQTRHQFIYSLKSSDNNLPKNKDQGRLKAGILRLPPDSFIYGQSSTEDKEGVKDLIHRWQIHKNSKKVQDEPNFKHLNSLSVAKGLSKASEFRIFRKSRSIKSSSSRNKLTKSNSEASIASGLPLRPSTPIKDVLSHHYAQNLSDQNLNFLKKTQTRGILRYGSTRGFELLKTSKISPVKKLKDFKMKKFHSVQGRIECWRNK